MSDLDDAEQFQTKHANSVFDEDVDGEEGQQEDLIGEEEVGHSHSPGLTAIATQMDDDIELHSHRSNMMMDDEMSLGLHGQMVTEIPLENPSTTSTGYHTPQLDTPINMENTNQEQETLFEVNHSDSPVNVDITGTASSTREGGKVRFGPALCQNGFSILAFVLVATGLVWLELVRWNEQDHNQSIAYIMIWICLIAAALGIAGLFTWIFFTQILLWFSQFVSIALVLLLALVHILSTGGSTTVLFLCFTMIAIMSYWLWRNHHRKQFAGVMLDLVAEVVQENPMLVVVAILVLFVQTLWLILFAVTCVEVLTLKLYGFAYVYLFFAAFWTTQVMKHIVHTTVAGTMAHWYFNIPVTGSRMRIPITCLKRSVTTSFGPICRGSLLVSPSRMLWAGFRHLNKWSHRFVVCLCEKLFWFTEALFHNFNKHAFTHVIMYGKDYASASRDTWDLFFAHGVDAIVRQDKVYTLALYPAIGCGCLLSIICAMWASHKQLYDEWLAMTCVAFAIGFSTVALTTEVMEGAVATIFACFAEDPRPLSSTHPTMFHRFVRIAELATFRDKRTVPI